MKATNQLNQCASVAQNQKLPTNKVKSGQRGRVRARSLIMISLIYRKWAGVFGAVGNRTLPSSYKVPVSILALFVQPSGVGKYVPASARS